MLLLVMVVVVLLHLWHRFLRLRASGGGRQLMMVMLVMRGIGPWPTGGAIIVTLLVAYAAASALLVRALAASQRSVDAR